VVLVCSGVVWGAELLFPKSAASAIALVIIIVLGGWLVRPGWNLLLARFGRRAALLFGLILASAAACFLVFFEVPLRTTLRR